MADPLSDVQLDQFHRDGYLIERGLASTELIASMNLVIDDSVNPALAPVEYEADVHYPGAPESKSAPGGQTPRRLLNAYTRDGVFRQWANSVEVVSRLRQMINCDQVMVSQNHHNCVMTKHPGYSSVTSWHQDIRYWSFDHPELISVWLALGPEHRNNGGLLLIPGSHQLNLERGRLDASLFLRTELEQNRELIARAVPAELEAGDTLFFHCRTFHAAGQNEADVVKKSLVYTYHAEENRSIPETRSAVHSDIVVGDLS